ncbi:hypothetical protein [Halorarius halobius]|nr:hypothetical protein [Halorarius halobius]
MRGTSPPPLVPEMPTETTTTSDPALAADGGERGAREQVFDAPLVPDCS